LLYQFGKNEANPDAFPLKYSDYFNIQYPMVFGKTNLIADWGMLGNDIHGDCVWAGIAHQVMLWNKEEGKTVSFTTKNALSDYSAVTGFNPSNPKSDNGTDMEAATNYINKTGVIDSSGHRHKVDAFVSLKPGDTDQLTAATYLFGSVGVGIKVSIEEIENFQNGIPWEPNNNKITSGHYIPCVGRNRLGNFLVVSWGRIHAMTPEFYQQRSDETICYLSLENINSKGLSPRQFNKDQLTKDLNQLNG
jgi:hypothetical protein